MGAAADSKKYAGFIPAKPRMISPRDIAIFCVISTSSEEALLNQSAFSDMAPVLFSRTHTAQ